VIGVPDAKGLDDALGRVAKVPPGALIVTASPFFGTHRRKVAEVAQQRRIPSVGYDVPFVVDGFLLSYGPSIADSYRRTAVYVDRILKGAKPADLPVEQATKFELAVNLRTARILGLTIPPSVLNRADHVIE